MSDTRTLDERYAEIGAELIGNEPSLAHIRDSGATICYLSSTARKSRGGKAVKGECERVADKNKWAIPCDFTVTVFEPNCEGMSDDQMRILIFHELLHVGIASDGSGEERYSIVPHDLEDFRIIVDSFGSDWSTPVG